MTDSYYPLWADRIGTINVSFSDPDNNPNNVFGSVGSSNFNLTNSTLETYMNVSSSLLNFSTATHKSALSASQLTTIGNFKLETSGALDISAGSITLNGTAAPTTSGQALIANDAANGGLKWFTITDLLQLEAGVFSNTNSSTGANITFAQPYGTKPSVVITPDCGINGRIIPVSLAGVSTTGFSAIFGSSKLDSFNFVVLPNNSSYSIINSGSNFSDSVLNASTNNIST